MKLTTKHFTVFLSILLMGFSAISQTTVKPEGAISISTSYLLNRATDSVYVQITGSPTRYYNIGVYGKINKQLADSLLNIRNLITASDAGNVKTTGDQSINGIKQFNTSLIAGTTTGSYSSGSYDWQLRGVGTIDRNETRSGFARPFIVSLNGNAVPTTKPGIFVDYHGLDISGNGGIGSNTRMRLYPFESTARMVAEATSTDTLGKIVGGYFQTTNIGSGVVQSAVNMRIRSSNTGVGSILDGRGIEIESPLNTGGGVYDTYYGIYVNPILGATTNWGIYSNTYNNYFAELTTGRAMLFRGSTSGVTTLQAQAASPDLLVKLPTTAGSLATVELTLPKASPVYTSRMTGELLTLTRTETATSTPTTAPLNLDFTYSPSSALTGGTDYKGIEVIQRTSSANINANARMYAMRGVSTNSSAVLGLQRILQLEANNTGTGTVNSSILANMSASNTGGGIMSDVTALNVSNPTNTGGGSITRFKGLNIAPITTAGIAYGLYVDHVKNYVASMQVGLKTEGTTPTELLQIGNAGTLGGTMSLAGATSGKVIIKPTAVVTDYTLTLPANAGTSGYVLSTDGSGSTSWTNPTDTTASPFRSKTNSLTLAQLQTKFNGYVPATRLLTAGWGINTLGNLSADRTVSVDSTSATGAVSKDRLNALNATVVHKSGTETINGSKTFTSNIIAPIVQGATLNDGYFETNSGGPFIVRNQPAGNALRVQQLDITNTAAVATFSNSRGSGNEVSISISNGGGGGGSLQLATSPTAARKQTLRDDDGIIPVIKTDGSIILPASTAPAYGAGKLFYDSDNESLTFYNNDANVSMQIGQEAWVRVVNNTGSTIANGAVVYVNGSSAGLPTIALAQSNSATTTVGLGLTTENIVNGATGYVTSLGLVRGLNTSAFSVGAVYIDPTTAGALTQTVPTAGNYRYRVGFVTSVNASTGTIHVTPSTAVRDNIVVSAVLDFPSTAINANQTLTVVATGAAIGDAVTIGLPTASIPASNHNYQAWVSSANTVSVRFNNNVSTGSVDPASGTFTLRIIK